MHLQQSRLENPIEEQKALSDKKTSVAVSYNQEICGNIFYCGKFLCAALHITLVHNHTNITVSFRHFKHVLELTGILLGCCSRISLTSSTRCSVEQKKGQWASTGMS